MDENGVKNEFEFFDDYKQRFRNSFWLLLLAAPWPMAAVVNSALLIALVCIVVAASVAMAIGSKQLGTKQGKRDFYFYLAGAAMNIMLLVCYFVLLKSLIN